MNTRIFSFFVLLTLLFGCSPGPNTGEKNKLSAQEFANQIKSSEDAQIIDVRTPEEYAGGHLEQARNMDWNNPDFHTQAEALDRSKPVFVYCLSGGRSAAAAEDLRGKGFKQVYELAGGMLSWRAEKLPETTAASRTKTAGISDQEYQDLIDSDKLVLVDFYADWCIPCKKMEPTLKEFARELKDKLVVVRIDAEANPELCQKLRVQALPTLKLYKNKILVWERVGIIGKTELRHELTTN